MKARELFFSVLSSYMQQIIDAMKEEKQKNNDVADLVIHPRWRNIPHESTQKQSYRTLTDRTVNKDAF